MMVSKISVKENNKLRKSLDHRKGKPEMIEKEDEYLDVEW
jgi:hypothetical protein